MPILIPPTDVKLFNEFASVFNPLWSEAHNRLRSADRLLIIGYSFPPTDTHALELLDSFVAHDGQKLVEIVDPYGEAVMHRIKERLGNRAKVVLHKATLAEYLGLPNEILKQSDSEVAKYESNNTKFPQEMTAMGESTDIERQTYIENLLIYLSVHNEPFDMTTYSGKRFLDCKLVGEFAMHMEGNYRPETHAYRIANISFKSGNNTEQIIGIKDVWIINPLPKNGIHDDMLAAAELADAGPELRQMIKESFHCKDDIETDYFLRRYLAS